MSKLKSRVVAALKQGWSPGAVCWSSAWGFTIGLFPIYGFSMLTLGLIGWAWKLNHPILQGFNHLVAPLKFLLIIPYIRFGEWLFRTRTPFTLSIPEFTLRFKDAPLRTLGEFGMTFVHAICGWLVTVPVLLLVAYAVMHILIRAGDATRAHIQQEVSP